jgi:hypothetical protein
MVRRSIGQGDIPGYRLGSRLLVSFGVAKNHCAFYPGAYPIRAHEDELTGYDLAKGTIRFPAEKPLPARLVKKLVKTRCRSLRVAHAGEIVINGLWFSGHDLFFCQTAGRNLKKSFPPNENKISDVWRGGAWLWVEGGISWKVRNRAC